MKIYHLQGNNHFCTFMQLFIYTIRYFYSTITKKLAFLLVKQKKV